MARRMIRSDGKPFTRSKEWARAYTLNWVIRVARGLQASIHLYMNQPGVPNPDFADLQRLSREIDNTLHRVVMRRWG
jgi:hypothetical protein